MKQYRFMENKSGKIGLGVFLFAMLLLARDSMITTAILGLNRSQYLMLGLTCVCGLLFLFWNRNDWKQILCDRRVLAVVLCSVILLLPMAVKQDWQMMYFSILFCLIFAVFLTFFTSVQETAWYYVVIATGLSIYSLVALYILKPLAYAGTIAPSIFYNAAGEEFFNFGLSFVVTNLYWHRNFGMFREPGVYQFFILLALYLNNYAVSWRKSGHMWLVNLVLVATMVSTFAIGGVVEMGLLAVFLYFDKKWYREKWGKIMGVAVVAAAAAVLIHIIMEVNTPYFELTIYYEFYDMFVRLTTDSDSLVDRLSAIFTNAKLFLQNPLFGDTIANVLHGTNHNTSSTLILYAVFGVLGGTLNVAAWVALAWKKDRSFLGNLLLLVILFMSFNTQNLVADVFFWLFPMMALVERGLPKLKLPAKKV